MNSQIDNKTNTQTIRKANEQQHRNMKDEQPDRKNRHTEKIDIQIDKHRERETKRQKDGETERQR